jgi:hypothetical protein
MSEPIYQGYTYDDWTKYCARCGGINDNPLCSLCDVCRRGDALAEYLRDDEGLIEAAKKIREESEMAKDDELTKAINRNF